MKNLHELAGSARSKLLVILSICGLMAAVNASAVTIAVDGKSNIWGAGHSSPGADGSGVLPPLHSFTAGAGQVVRFSSVEGIVSGHGPDGYIDPRTIGAASGISGITLGSMLALVGVFLDNTEPTGAPPPSLDFTGALNFSSLAPVLNQLFFIGDGLTGTGTGTTQSFLVPDTATRLYLGPIDAHFGGSPGAYFDNTGSFTATFEITSVPEPTTLALMGLGLAGIGYRRKRAA
jgi:hypothetical protein